MSARPHAGTVPEPSRLRRTLLAAWRLAAHGEPDAARQLVEGPMESSPLPRQTRETRQALFLISRVDALIGGDACRDLVWNVTDEEPSRYEIVQEHVEFLARTLRSMPTPLQVRAARRMGWPPPHELPPIEALLRDLPGADPILRAADAMDDAPAKGCLLAHAARGLALRGDAPGARVLFAAAEPLMPLRANGRHETEAVGAMAATAALLGDAPQARAWLGRLAGPGIAARHMARAGLVDFALSILDALPPGEERDSEYCNTFSDLCRVADIDGAIRVGRRVYDSARLDVALLDQVVRERSEDRPAMALELVARIASPNLRSAGLRLAAVTFAEHSQPEPALALLDAMAEPADRVEALVAIATAYARRRASRRAIAAWRSAAKLAASLPHRWQAAVWLGRIGTAAWQAGKRGLALRVLTHAAKRAADIERDWQRAACLHDLALRASGAGADDLARELMERSLLCTDGPGDQSDV